MTPSIADAETDAASSAWTTSLARLLPAVLAHGGQMFAVKDARNGRYVHVDSRFAAWLQRPAADVAGRVDGEVFDPVVAGVLRVADQTALAQTDAAVAEHRIDVAGQRHDVQVLRLASAPDADGRRWLYSVWTDRGAALQRDAQQRQALEQLEQLQRANESLRRELADQALRDPGTGLYTRAHFEDQLRREVDLSTREHREFAVVFVEIDPLSERVRALGAPAEARILEAMGRLLRGGTRAMDASCRYDEQRFAVLLSGVGLATAHARMEGLRRQCAAQIVVQTGHELAFTVSMGVASFPHTAQTQDALLSAGSAALAEARRRGGNHVTLAAIPFESPAQATPRAAPT